MPAHKHPGLLTHRQNEVMALVATGLTNKGIAYRLRIRPDTVRKHTLEIYGRMGVECRVSAVVAWMNLR